MDLNQDIEQCRTSIENCSYPEAAKALGFPAWEARKIQTWVDGVHRPAADRVIALAQYLEVSPQALGALFMVAWIDRALDAQAPAMSEPSPVSK